MQQAQAKAQRLNSERDRRENLFGRFIDEASKHYADALQHERDDPSQFMVIYALTNRMRLVSSSRVIESADRVTRHIVDTYLAPNMSLHEYTARAQANEEVDLLRGFAEACREELRQFGLP